MVRFVVLSLLAATALGGCATRGRMPERCNLKELDPTFSVVRGEERKMFLGELAAANAAASVDNFNFKTSKQFVALSGDRAVVCQLASCSPAWWSFERVDGKWVNRSHSPAICVVR